MDLMSRLSDGYGNLIIFSGRATRLQFWTLYVANLLILLLCLQLGHILPDAFSMLVVLFGIAAVTLGNLSVTVRRLHDTNHSGWWVLAFAVPVLIFVLVWFLMKPSVSGPTRYDAHTRSPTHPAGPLTSILSSAKALGS